MSARVRSLFWLTNVIFKSQSHRTSIHPPFVDSRADPSSHASAFSHAGGLVKGYLSARLLPRVAMTFPNPLHSSATWELAGTLEVRKVQSLCCGQNQLGKAFGFHRQSLCFTPRYH